MNFDQLTKPKSFMRKPIILVLFLALVWGCDDFGNMNVDPNNPSEPQTSQMLTQAQRGIDTQVGAVTPTHYVQYIASTQYTDADRYSLANFDFEYWYTEPLTNLQRIIDLNSNEETAGDVLEGGSNANQIAVARILKAYFFHTMTDRWGYIPYTEALQGQEQLRPAYDSQQDIYYDILETLEDAVGQMDGGAGVSGDILFSGDMGKWREFANSLRMRAAMRIADVDESTAQQHFEDAASDGYITENVMYPYLASENNENPWYDRFETRTDYAIAELLADTMKTYDDYRLLSFALPAPDEDNGNGVVDNFDEVVGMPYGDANAGDIPNSEISFPVYADYDVNDQQDRPLPIMTLAEVHFLLAEANARNWNVNGTAQDHYEAGIEASWDQWNRTEDVQAYYNQADIQWDAGSWKEQIAYQKWIALFPLGYEAWAEWRRLDGPELRPLVSPPLNESGETPVRQGYPPQEAELNSENYDEAVNAQGLTTGLDTPHWWDMN